MLSQLFPANSDVAIMRRIYDVMCLPYMRERVLASEIDRTRSENNPFLTKLVIGYWPDSDVELRINTYSGKLAPPNIHGHRWSFYSMILNGNMRHIRYNNHDNMIRRVVEEEFGPGDIYGLHEEELHTTIASDDLVTLLLRGPVTREKWGQYNMKGEPLNTFSDISHRHEQLPLIEEQVHECLSQIPRKYLAL